MAAFGMQVAALDPQRALHVLLAFFLVFDTQQNTRLHNLVETARDAFQFAGHVVAQSRRYFQMVSTDGQIHKTSLEIKVFNINHWRGHKPLPMNCAAVVQQPHKHYAGIVEKNQVMDR
jgi:hypothetical protein